MKIQCPVCRFPGNIDETQIYEQGRNVKCPKCGGVFPVKRPGTEQPPESPPSPPQPVKAEESPVSPEQEPASDSGPTGKEQLLPLLEKEIGDIPGEEEEEKEAIVEKPAGFWIRLVAFQLDALILSYITLFIELGLALLVSIGKTELSSGSDLISILFFSWLDIQGSTPGLLICFLVPLFYSVYFWHNKGATPGKMFLGIRVVSMYGGYLSPVKALIRYAGYLVSFLPLALGFIWIGFNRDKKGWHDYFAESRVVKVKEFSLFRLILALLLPWVPYIIIFFMLSSLILMGFSTITHDLWESAIEKGAKAVETGVREGVKEGVIEYKTMEDPRKLVHRPLEKQIVEDAPQAVPGITASRYEQLFSTITVQRRKDPFEHGPSFTTGPVHIQRSTFWEDTKSPHIWLKVRIAPIPNISLKGTLVRLSINTIAGKSGENLYDGSSGFEEPLFNQLTLNRTAQTDFTAIRDVRMLAGAKERDISSISGSVFFTLPLNIKISDKPLDPKTINEPIKTDGNSITITEFNENMILITYKGDITKLMDIFAFDKEGKRIRQRSRSTEGAGDLHHLKYHFYGPVRRIQVVTATGFMEKEFPFTL